VLVGRLVHPKGCTAATRHLVGWTQKSRWSPGSDRSDEKEKTMNRGLIGTIIGVLVVIILVIVILQLT
jgi:hypothetical protein